MLSPVPGWEEKSGVWSGRASSLWAAPRLSQCLGQEGKPGAKHRAKQEPCSAQSSLAAVTAVISSPVLLRFLEWEVMLELLPLRAELPVWWVASLGHCSIISFGYRLRGKRPFARDLEPLGVLNFLGKAVLKDSPCRKGIHHRPSRSPSWEISHLIPFCTLIPHSKYTHPNMSF